MSFEAPLLNNQFYDAALSAVVIDGLSRRYRERATLDGRAKAEHAIAYLTDLSNDEPHSALFLTGHISTEITRKLHVLQQTGYREALLEAPDISYDSQTRTFVPQGHANDRRIYEIGVFYGDSPKLAGIEYVDDITFEARRASSTGGSIEAAAI